MSEENRIRFAGLMEEYLNIPSFVCELIEKQLEDNKYKEVIEYVVQRRNEIENKEDYLSEQEKINQYLDLQQKVEQLEKENEELINKLNIDLQWARRCDELENIRREAIEYIEKDKLNIDESQCYVETQTGWKMIPEIYEDLLNILNKGSESNE